MLRVLGIRAAMPPFSFALISRLSGSRFRWVRLSGFRFRPKRDPVKWLIVTSGRRINLTLAFLVLCLSS